MTRKNYRKSILVISPKYCNYDSRILREINALVHEGYKVDQICLRRSIKAKKYNKEGVQFYSFPIKKKRTSIKRYIFEYIFYGLYVFIMTNWLYYKNRYKVIIPFVMPEFIVLACIIPKVFGAKIIMDWEDPSLEVFLAKFVGKESGFFCFLIKLIEKISVRLANVIITPNEGFRRAFVARGHKREKIHIVLNAPDPIIFNENKLESDHKRKNEQFVILYNGFIAPRHGLDILIKALAVIVEKRRDVVLQIVGGGEEDYFRKCENLGKELGLERYIIYEGGVDIIKMCELIRKSSVGVVANRRDPFTLINFPQRIFEFAILKRPIIVPRLPGIMDYYDENSMFFFEPENYHVLADKVINLAESPEKSLKIIQNAYELTKKLEWQDTFLRIVKQFAE